VLYQLSYRRIPANTTRSRRADRTSALWPDRAGGCNSPAGTRPPPPAADRALYPSVVVKRMIVPTVASLLGAALLGLLVYGVTHQAPSRTLDQAVAVGHWPPAPEAVRSLPALTGDGAASLAAYRGRVVVLNFWASWCTACEEEAPALEHTQHELQRHGGTVLGITYKDVTTDSLGFIRGNHLTYPNLRDATGSFAQSYGTDKLPETFVIDRSGQVVAISRGEVTQPFLERAVRLARSGA
jgi:cytochrome c biogenesis protein CcmG, thiol:disulfide interchange protein DsbE